MSVVPVYDSFRVQQVAGLFDVPLAERATASFAVEVPALDEPWQIGLIVGPCGSGKTTIARAAFGEACYCDARWPADRAVIDGFGDLPIAADRRAADGGRLQFAAGVDQALPRAQRRRTFRCDLARAASPVAAAGQHAAMRPLVVFDEFTSVVDRTVAQIGSAAVAKACAAEDRLPLRGRECHYDVAEWLEPDWVLDMATRRLERRRLRRPAIELEIFRCHRRSGACLRRITI